MNVKGTRIAPKLKEQLAEPVARTQARPATHHLATGGTTQMVEKRVPIKAAQQRLGHTRPDILLKHYAHVFDESAEFAAEALSLAIEH